MAFIRSVGSDFRKKVHNFVGAEIRVQKLDADLTVLAERLQTVQVELREPSLGGAIRAGWYSTASQVEHRHHTWRGTRDAAHVQPLLGDEDQPHDGGNEEKHACEGDFGRMLCAIGRTSFSCRQRLSAWRNL